MSAPWKFDLYIDAKWTSGEGAGVIDVIDPATEESIGQVPEATVGDARRAIAGRPSGLRRGALAVDEAA